MNWYPISFNEAAHSNDVKSVVYLNEETFATASRDGSIKLWSIGGAELKCLTSLHEGFINALAYCESEDCLLSGGNDKLISVWSGREESNQALLIGHEGNVCKLTVLPAACAPFVVASASWDGSARLWTAEWNPASSVVFQDRAVEGPCWSVAAAGPDTFVTAHADGVLRWWRGERCIRSTCAAHSDVIRDLVSLEEGKFVASCSNDGAIKVWESASGKLVAAQIGAHSAFIYSLTGRGDLLASCGEEGWLKVWRFNGEQGTLTGEAELRLPQLSVWNAGFSPFGTELIAACSGGSIYRFSTQPSNSEVKMLFQNRLDAFLISLQGKQEDLEKASQPASVLLAPGKQPGQNVIVRNDTTGALEAHQWTGTEWQALGAVVGKAAPSGKQRSEADGLEYDFVFKVELDEEGRSYELPYNSGQNPYFVAQNFLERNELPISYLDQVAKFIFTSAGSAATEAQAIDFEPVTKKANEMIAFREFNKEGIEKKLKEFGMLQPFTLNDAINALSTWPIERIFPVLDWLRVEALKSSIPVKVVPFDRIVDAVAGDSASKSLSAALTMALRFYCNVLVRAEKKPLVGAGALIEIVGECTALSSANPAWSSLLLSLLKNMKLSGQFEGKVLLALLIGVLQENKQAGKGSADIAVIIEGLQSEPLYYSLIALLQ